MLDLTVMRPNSPLLVWIVLALAAACRTGPISVSAWDAARDDTPGTGGRPMISIPGMGGVAGGGGAAWVGGQGGTDVDASQEHPSDCSFGALWDEMVYRAAIIGSCLPVAVCDTAAASTDAGTASCSPVMDLGKDTLVFEQGTLVIKGPYSNIGCVALVFDDEGRLVGGWENIPAWSDCRWPSYAGKSYYYYCFSE